jgi:hypothetical protein
VVMDSLLVVPARQFGKEREYSVRRQHICQIGGPHLYGDLKHAN